MKRFGFIFIVAALLVLAFAVPISAEADVSALYFKDVPVNAWYYTYVYDLADKGIITGYEDSTFRPENNISRAEIATILARMSRESTASYDDRNTFSDCRSNHWADEYVNWAAAKGIVNGVGNGKFDPDAPITREAICTMVMRYAKYKAFYPQKIEEGINFADDAQISAWAKDSVYHMQRADIINGKGNNRFEPQSRATRAECSKIFYSYLRCNDDMPAHFIIDDFGAAAEYYGSVSSYYLADFTHDGYEDLFIVVPTQYGAELYIYTSLGGHVDCVFSEDIYATAYIENYYIYQDAKGAYLLYYLHDSATGQTEQAVSLFHGSPYYNQINYIFDRYQCFYMDGSPLDVGVPQAYYNDKALFRNYEAKSTFLFGCNDQTMIYNGQSYEDAIGNWNRW